MSKKGKNIMNDFENTPDNYLTPEEVIVPVIPPTIPEEKIEKPNYNIIKIEFPNAGTKVEYINQATGSTDYILAPNGELRIIHGKMYKVPVDNKTINSDDFAIIKVFSDMASLIEVKSIKDGFALIVPVRHNVSIRHGERICVVC